MTEKEFRKLVSDVEVSRIEKDAIQSVINRVSTNLEKEHKYFEIVLVSKGGSLCKSTMLNTSKEFDIVMSVRPKIKKTFGLVSKVILNEVASILIDTFSEITKASDITVFDDRSRVSFRLNDDVFNIYVYYDELTLDMPSYLIYEVEQKRERFVELANKEYSYFKNTIQIIKYYRDEQHLQGISGLIIEVLLYYSLKEYSFDIRYEDYINAFLKGLDDFINGKKIEITDQMYEALNVEKKEALKKSFTIIDAGSGLINLAEEINEIKIGEFRKLRKALGKLVDTKSLKDLSSGVVKLNVNPIINSDGTISWSYKIEDSNFSGSGGNLPNNKESEYTCIYKALLKGLKAVIDNNLNRKQVEIICSNASIIDSDQAMSAENAARRKNVKAYIDNNQIKITNKKI